ncbi:ABC transporter ATP-binding protein [Metabacillus halosaccharovorans]|uniref:ABC transporter ATP-binding protein n=1 Tax=Bacillaceae TaxID=186817 RepID=UPI00047E8903|nr:MULTISPECIES: ABC transporter ATP-binding protein [Bacillaceae]MCM3440403.1 ABC transporter ATP-binding protein [Metabacillus halosaccharovorans]
MSKNEVIIHAKNLTRKFKMGNVDVIPLKNVSFDIQKGSFTTIIGPSGSGKSTLLNLLGLVDSPTSGELYINGLKVHEQSDHQLTKLRAKYIGFIFQSFHLIPVLNVLDNVMLQLSFSDLPKSEHKEAAINALEQVGLGDKLRNYPNDLSGGQRQRVSIARAIAKKPEIILADEPTGSLDSKTGEGIISIIEELHKLGKTIIMVTHDLDIAARAENQLVLRDGEIRETRTKDQKELMKVY